jgi:hypothetical protein
VLVPSVLLALPPSVRVLELNTPCAGPALEALLCVRLQELRITGSGAGIAWGGRGAAHVLPKLVQLRLDRAKRSRDDGHGDIFVEALPDGIASPLAAATNLHSLEIHAIWSGGVPALCKALPALMNLR